MPGRIEGPPPYQAPTPPEDISPKPKLGDDDETPTTTFLGMPMSEKQKEQAWNSLMNDIGRAINHDTQRALEALKELKKSLTGEEDT